ncbi:hypothetical protein EDD18DRAFT_1379776, partial [Armillaria luteobubalina]
ILQTGTPSSSTCILPVHSSLCVSQLLLSSLSRSSRYLRSPAPSKLGMIHMAMSTTRTKTVGARITTTETKAKMTAVETAPGRRCLSTRMISMDGIRQSTPPTSTRKSVRSPLRSNVRACARKTTDVTLARRTLMMRRTTNSSASYSWRSSTSTPGRKTVMMARTAKTTRMERRMARRTTGSTTTLLPGMPTTDTKRDETCYRW